MITNTIGSTLRSLRENSNLSVKEVVLELKKYGQDISDKTLYSYESDKRASSADMLIALCQIYKCNNILEVFSDVEVDYSIPDDTEYKIIEKYRPLDGHGKKIVDMLLDAEYTRCTTTPETINEERAPYNVLRLPQPDNRASAGFGGDLSNDTNALVSVIANRDTIRADFCLYVDGHSMEPLYNDGDLVLVHKQPAVDVGEIGIFVANDKGYIKKQGADRLISVNPEYPDVDVEECYEYRCCGKVIGVVDPEWIIE